VCYMNVKSSRVLGNTGAVYYSIGRMERASTELEAVKTQCRLAETTM